MIISIDHIAFGAVEGEEDSIKLRFPGYRELFQEHTLDNINIKLPYMAEKQKQHNLIYMIRDKAIPIEITSYLKCVNRPSYLSYDIIKNYINILSPNVNLTLQFFEHFGFTSHVPYGGGVSEMKFISPLSRFPVYLQIRESNEAISHWLLDQAGMCTLAFMTNHLERQKDEFIQAGYQCTSTESLLVNNRTLKICFIEGPCGEVIELLGTQ